MAPHVHSEKQRRSCERCCDPGRGPNGDPTCWTAGFFFERCCNPVERVAEEQAQAADCNKVNAELRRDLRYNENRIKDYERAQRKWDEDRSDSISGLASLGNCR